jgi:hypothetical protein
LLTLAAHHFPIPIPSFEVFLHGPFPFAKTLRSWSKICSPPLKGVSPTICMVLSEK